MEGFVAAVTLGDAAEKTVGIPRLHPVMPQPWGQRAGFLIDPDGTQLNLIENVA